MKKEVVVADKVFVTKEENDHHLSIIRYLGSKKNLNMQEVTDFMFAMHITTLYNARNLLDRIRDLEIRVAELEKSKTVWYTVFAWAVGTTGKALALQASS
jgi:hypothetical protein